ncbi:MAG: septum formation inhibitor Maf [Candidatus Carbobacillus altaicus]|uniref:dTTP/UTP pyrophosphatase n=1 Tax=Candidatus Carbonibacillus altaicus TaxID=2163959 RepID=A0A2R6Y279_9BACL|nr:septum formation inhibitor Maf [Candidatus Carbobacillus altaicus]PTQ56753.1 MAG: Septum formation protein Maf [Candidatus Carbobacillus altaicus]
MIDVVLASSSPRRTALLDMIGLAHRTVPSKIEEDLDPTAESDDEVLRLAKAKGAHVFQTYPHALVLAFDTIVVVQGEILGKPKDNAQAHWMLRRLSGTWHEVITGVALFRKGYDPQLDVVKTRVKFAELTDRMIEQYVNTGEPFDKAGAYGIQGKGALLVERLEGDYYNVVGLPLQRTVNMLERLGISVW